MKLPKMFYGTNKEVSSRIKKYVKQLQPNINAFNDPEIEMMEIDLNKHYICLGHRTWYEENFYVYWLFEAIYQNKDNDNEFKYKCFIEALKAPWALLCLLGDPTSHGQLVFFDYPDAPKLYINAIAPYWNELINWGNIFKGATGEKNNIWVIFSNLKKALALLGVPNERLLNKTIPQDLIVLVNEYNKDWNK